MDPNPQPNPPQPAGFWNRIYDFFAGPQAWRVIALAVVVGLIIFASATIYRANPQDGFRDADFTRGLITLLLLVSVIAAMLLMIFTALFSTEENPPPAGGTTLEKRITFSRDIITPLVGILGTIVGFYFGSQQSRDVREAQKDAVVATARALTADQNAPDSNNVLTPPKNQQNLNR